MALELTDDALDLDRVDWARALDELRRLAREQGAAAGPRGAASPTRRGLSALFEGDFRVGAARVADALRRSSPLNPLHHVRRALHALRFGAWELALAAIEGGRRRRRSALPAARPRRWRPCSPGRSGARPTSPGTSTRPSRRSTSPGLRQAEAQIKSQPKEADGRAQSACRGTAAWATAWAHLPGQARRGPPGRGRQAGEAAPRGAPRAAQAASAEAAAVRKLHLLRTARGWRRSSRELAGGARGLAGRGARGHAARRGAARRRQGPLPAPRAAADPRGRARSGGGAAALRLGPARASRWTRRRPKRWAAALRAVEVCMRLEPHQPIHLQNRAAIVTATADDAYHDAWEELDRLHYRLALMGRLDGPSVRAMLKPHRMFASQARLTPKGEGGLDLGVFRVKEEREHGVAQRSPGREPGAPRRRSGAGAAVDPPPARGARLRAPGARPGSGPPPALPGRSARRARPDRGPGPRRGVAGDAGPGGGAAPRRRARGALAIVRGAHADALRRGRARRRGGGGARPPARRDLRRPRAPALDLAARARPAGHRGGAARTSSRRSRRSSTRG